MMKTDYKRTVLLADEEPFGRLGPSLVLRKAGYDVASACSATETLESAASAAAAGEPFDLVLVDLQIAADPLGDLIGRLRKHSRHHAVGIMSGSIDNERIAEVMQRGCLGYLEKPFEPSELVKWVEWALAKALEVREKEDKMHNNLAHSGLCSTCNHSNECGHLARALVPVLHCEEFDGGLVSAKGTEMASPGLPPTSTASLQKGLTGLCINCEWGSSCLGANREEGIWYCENFQ
jgi:DNA-binding NtrC family response regulator